MQNAIQYYNKVNHNSNFGFLGYDNVKSGS